MDKIIGWDKARKNLIASTGHVDCKTSTTPRLFNDNEKNYIESNQTSHYKYPFPQSTYKFETHHDEHVRN